MRTAVLLTASAIACARQPVREAPDVILISLDTMRRDRWCGLSEGSCAATPRLGRWTGRGTLYGGASTPSTFTLPSHMSVMTGLYPDVHGVAWSGDRLSPRVPLLAELLAQSGYRTEGVYSNMWLAPEFGFDRGFERFTPAEFELTFAARVSHLARESLDRLTATPRRPFLLFAHFLDPHSDFEVQTSSRLPYYSPDRFREHLNVGSDSNEFCTEDGRCATEYLLELNRSQSGLDSARQRLLESLYDAGVRYLDDELAKFFAELESRGLFDASLIIALADHGEELGEHGMFLHNHLYQESVAVPIWVKYPRGRGAGARFDDLVETVDILPTILREVGLSYPGHLQGRPLPRVGDPQLLPRPVFHVDRFVKSKFAFRASEWKLIYDLEKGEGLLFDLEEDPSETSNRSDAEPGVLADMIEQLASRVRANAELQRKLGAQKVRGRPLPDETLDQLRSIGYF